MTVGREDWEGREAMRSREATDGRKGQEGREASECRVGREAGRRQLGFLGSSVNSVLTRPTAKMSWCTIWKQGIRKQIFSVITVRTHLKAVKPW